MSKSESWEQEDTDSAIKFDKWSQDHKSEPISYYDDFGELVSVIDEASK